MLAEEFVLTEGVSRLPSDGVYWTFGHLLLDGTIEHEQWLASTLLGRKDWGSEGHGWLYEVEVTVRTKIMHVLVLLQVFLLI